MNLLKIFTRKKYKCKCEYKCECGNNLIEKPIKDYSLSFFCDDCLNEIMKNQIRREWKRIINNLSNEEFKRIQKIGEEMGIKIIK